MANLWETLDEDSKKALIAAHLEGNGGNTPENQNRAREQLINNPTLVAKLAKETGITEGDEVLQDEGDVAEEESIENTVDAALEDEGDVETAGSLPKTLPPPEEGEDVMKYYDRIRQTPKGMEIDRGDMTYETGDSTDIQDWRRIRPRAGRVR